MCQHEDKTAVFLLDSNWSFPPPAILTVVYLRRYSYNSETHATTRSNSRVYRPFLRRPLHPATSHMSPPSPPTKVMLTSGVVPRSWPTHKKILAGCSPMTDRPSMVVQKVSAFCPADLVDLKYTTRHSQLRAPPPHTHARR